MHRTISYILLFAALLAAQTYLFDNLAVSVYLDPLVYVVFIALLPMETPPVAMLLSGVVLGVATDWTMGAAGVNTIATVFVAFFRLMLLNLLCGKESVHDGGIPSPLRMGAMTYLRYLATIVVVHHALFFLLESLSVRHLLHVAVQTAASAAVTLAIAWIVTRLFTAKIVVRL